SLSDEMFTGRSTVPVLWDAGAARIVSNDSRSIIRSFTDLGRRLGNGAVDLAPAALHDRIEATNDWLFAELSNAVYQAGFAESQRAYDVAEAAVFETLDALDNHLAKHRYLLGEVITESDWRLFATLVRFDCVYAVLHRCSRKRLVDYPSLWAYARELYAWPGAAETVDFAEILQGSYLNDTSNNPHNIVPALPRADWQAPSDRGLFKPGLAWPMPDAAGFGPSL
ncbi:MAG: glutathione S-transferase C-terminal domain-containing protein, partial [Rhizobiaceae bacterium]